MRKGFNLSGNLVKFYRSLQTGHLGHFLGHFSLTEKVNWCRRSYFSLMPAKILWSASYILVTLALKIGYLRYKFQLYSVSRSWDTKGGCAVPSTHTIIVHSYGWPITVYTYFRYCVWRSCATPCFLNF